MNSTQTVVSVVIPVYRDGVRGANAAMAMATQSLPGGGSVEVVVVDDGSDDDTAERLDAVAGGNVRVLRLPDNRGRSAARNAGAAVAVGEVVVFIDCDCVPVGDDFLSAHLEALAGDTVASAGHVDGNGDGFWHRYQQTASVRRSRQHAEGLVCAGSSQNLAVNRAAFSTVGGFDTGYAHYGFEDRDLLLRLSEQGPVAWTEGATVRHLDDLSLVQVVAKMAEAGEWTSARFARRHPQAYRRLGYARVDSTLHPFLYWPARALVPVVPILARAGDALLARNWLPEVLGGAWVRSVSALAFLTGTSRRYGTQAGQ